MTLHDRPPIPAEREALDRPWRLWASVAVGAFVLVSAGLGFLLLPERDGEGFDPWASICRALGIPGYGTDARAAPAAAQPASRIVWSRDTRVMLRTADAERGATLAAEVCAACHGEAGVAPDANFPNLVRQSPGALFKQLHDYKTGHRRGGQAEVMLPVVEPLTEQQLADLAAFYALRPAPARAVAASAVMLPIERLARRGDPTRGLASCDSCHGASGAPDGTPALLGQSVPYLEQQLQLFASGERANDLYGRMRTFASQLTPEEMSGLALYYGGLAMPQYR